MNNILRTMALVVTMAACTDGTATAPLGADDVQLIVNGSPTGPTDFASVGALLYDLDANGVIDGNDAICTGSLIAPEVFLTASHCVNFLPPSAQVYVTFDHALLPATSGIIPAVRTHFARTLGPLSSNTQPDLAVVILPEGSTNGLTPYTLPPLNHLDQLAAKGGLRGALFANVGYGVSTVLTGKPTFSFDGNRNTSSSPFQALRGNLLILNMQTAATGEGGDCFGDSGSPKFLGRDRRIVVGVVSWGDAPCRATSVNHRVDTEASRVFLGQFVALP